MVIARYLSQMRFKGVASIREFGSPWYAGKSICTPHTPPPPPKNATLVVIMVTQAMQCNVRGFPQA